MQLIKSLKATARGAIEILSAYDSAHKDARTVTQLEQSTSPVTNAKEIKLAADLRMLVTALYFVPTNLGAFNGRGREKIPMSPDLEDFVPAIDGR